MVPFFQKYRTAEYKKEVLHATTARIIMEYAVIAYFIYFLIKKYSQ
jgi:hypothetical protein